MSTQEEKFNFNINLRNFMSSYDFSDDEIKFLLNLKYPLDQDNNPFISNPYIFSKLEESFGYQYKIIEFLIENHFDPKFKWHQDWEVEDGEYDILMSYDSFENFKMNFEKKNSEHLKIYLILENIIMKNTTNNYNLPWNFAELKENKNITMGSIIDNIYKNDGFEELNKNENIIIQDLKYEFENYLQIRYSYYKVSKWSIITTDEFKIEKEKFIAEEKTGLCLLSMCDEDYNRDYEEEWFESSNLVFQNEYIIKNIHDYFPKIKNH